MDVANGMKQVAAQRLRIGIVCAGSEYSAGLTQALTQSLEREDGPAVTSRHDADVLIYAFADADVAQPGFVARHSGEIDVDTASTKIFLELISGDALGPRAKETAQKNALIAQLTHDHGGYLVPLMSKFMRWESARLLTETGTLSPRGYQAIARTVLKFIDRLEVRRSLDTNEKAHANGPSISAEEIFSHLRWPGADLPQTTKFAPDEGNITDFLGGYASFPSYPKWGRVKLDDPVDWSMPGPNRSWQSYFLGLDFLGPSLSTYALLASNERPRDAQTFRALLNRNGIGAPDLLRRTGEVIADFLHANPPEAPQAQRAWHEGTVCRRIKILLDYLICCRTERDQGGMIVEETVGAAFASLKSSLELLRSESVYIKSGNHGVRQDSLFIVTALLFSDSDEFRGLLGAGMDRLQRHQLDTMLAPDGVWLENSFEYHRLVMGVLADLISDMHEAGAEGIEPLLDALARMVTFTEAVVKNDGQAPLIGDTTPREALRAIRSARALVATLRGEGEPERARDFLRTQEDYLFPASGYFASHSARAPGPDVSSLIFYANLSTPKHKHADDLSVLFSHGGTDFLIDGGTYNKETSDDIRNAARFDPATHNTYRVNGKSYSLRAQKGEARAGIVAQWSGDDWAAAHGFNHAYEGAAVDRFVIHLKRHNALVVVDHLKSNSLFTACDFEQFWHVAPQFEPSRSRIAPISLVFSSPKDGHLLAAFEDGTSTCKTEQGGPGDPLAWLMTSADEIVPTPYIRRARRARRATMASVFQWSPIASDLKVKISGSTVDVQGVDLSARFSVRAGEVRCLRLAD